MLSRRNARVKVMQTLYAFSQDEEQQIEWLRKNLYKSIYQSFELYLFNILVLIEVADYSRLDMEMRKSKYLPTEEDKMASPKLAQSSIVSFIKNNEQFNKLVKKYKLPHYLDQELIKKLFQKTFATDEYKQYLLETNTNIKQDKKILEYIYNEIMLPDEDFLALLEEIFPTWLDDFDVIIFSINATLEDIQKNKGFIKLDEFVEKLNDAENFAQEILDKTLSHSEQHTDLIAPKLKNWEVERIAVMDMILMKMALTEILDFPTIPLKVTMNEYIDISKKYSTPKSKEFINGVLDKLMKELKEEGKIYKSGRGLNE